MSCIDTCPTNRFVHDQIRHRRHKALEAMRQTRYSSTRITRAQNDRTPNRYSLLSSSVSASVTHAHTVVHAEDLPLTLKNYKNFSMSGQGKNSIVAEFSQGDSHKSPMYWTNILHSVRARRACARCATTQAHHACSKIRIARRVVKVCHRCPGRSADVRR
jgi:hypothetical protein